MLPSVIPQLRMYSTATTIPPFRFRLPQADYHWTILGIQYNDSTVLILRDSADAFDDFEYADALQQIHRYPLMIPRIPFDDSADDLRITHAANLQIL